MLISQRGWLFFWAREGVFKILWTDHRARTLIDAEWKPRGCAFERTPLIQSRLYFEKPRQFQQFSPVNLLNSPCRSGARQGTIFLLQYWYGPPSLTVFPG